MHLFWLIYVKFCLYVYVKYKNFYFFLSRNNAYDDDNVKIVAVDLQAMAPLPGVIQIQGDITKVCILPHLSAFLKVACKIISCFCTVSNLNSYYKVTILDFDETYWRSKIQSIKFSVLSLIGKRILCMTATSVPVEIVHVK